MPTEAEVIVRLKQEWGTTLQNMGLRFDEIIEIAKTKSQKKKLMHVDARFYSYLAQTNPMLRADLEWKIQEGVLEQDFLWWWDMPDIERQLIIVIDYIRDFGYLETLREQGNSDKEAIRLALQVTPTYIEFCDTSKLPNNNPGIPLPMELRNRIERRIKQEIKNDYFVTIGKYVDFNLILMNPHDPTIKQWRAFCHQFSSVNALVRHEIAAGRL